MFKVLKKVGTVSIIIAMAIFTVAEAKTGGPDAFGYTFTDSHESGGPAFQMIDISGTGANYMPNTDDDVAPNIPIGFDFPFYGNNYSAVTIGSNGAVKFGSAEHITYFNTSIPDASDPNNIIAAVWDDIVVPSGVYTQTFANCPSTEGGSGQCMVIMWKQARHCCSSGNWDFELILYKNGNIIFNEGEGNPEHGSESTTGIENIDATIGLQYSYDTTDLDDNLSVLFQIAPIGAPDINVTDSVDPYDDLLVPFGLVEVGSSSQEETVTVTNSGNSDLMISSVNLTAQSTPAIEMTDFIITSDNCGGQTLAADASCDITVQFVPESSCRKTAQLNIESNDPDQEVVAVTLEGIGNGGPLNPDNISIMNTNPQKIRLNGPTIVTVKNQSESPKSINEIGLFGGDSDSFSVESEFAYRSRSVTVCGALPRILQPLESCVLSVSFSPEEMGIKQTTLGVFSEDGCAFLDLTGGYEIVIRP